MEHGKNACILLPAGGLRNALGSRGVEATGPLQEGRNN